MYYIFNSYNRISRDPRLFALPSVNASSRYYFLNTLFFKHTHTHKIFIFLNIYYNIIYININIFSLTHQYVITR
mgnify:CR=1 FL=1